MYVEIDWVLARSAEHALSSYLEDIRALQMETKQWYFTRSYFLVDCRVVHVCKNAI